MLHDAKSKLGPTVGQARYNASSHEYLAQEYVLNYVGSQRHTTSEKHVMGLQLKHLRAKLFQSLELSFRRAKVVLLDN